MKTEKQLLDELIDDLRKDKVKTEFGIDFYKKQLRNPTKIGVADAKEGIEVREKHIAYLLDNIKQYEEYKKQKYGE